MVKLVGREAAIGIKKQATRGTTETTVTNAVWIPRVSFDFRDVAENVQNEATLDVLDENFDAVNTMFTGEGDISGNVRLKEFGHFLTALLGAPTTTGATPYTHTFKMVQDPLSPQYTVFKKDSVQSVRYGNAVLTGLEIEAGLGAFVSFSSNWMAKKGDDHSPTPDPSYGSDDFFVTKQITVNYGGDCYTNTECIFIIR